MENSSTHSSLKGQRLDDPGRLAALQASGLLDAPAEEVFDRFTRLASKLLHTPVSLISLVDSDRQFFKSQTGLPAPWDALRQTPLEYSFCQYVVRDGISLNVQNARMDHRLKHNRAIQELGVTAYLGIPISSDDGFILGSFCVIETNERVWSDEDLALLQDLGKSLASEISLRERTQMLQKILEDRLFIEQQKEESARMLVHDLRVPLAGVVAGLELLEDKLDSSDSEQIEYIAIARSGAKELLEIINDILEVQRMNSGHQILELGHFSAMDLCRSVFKQMLPLAEKNGQKLLVRYPEEDFRFNADEGLMRRVLLNLISNALKYAGAGAEVLFSSETTKEGKITLLVEDNGPGVPDELKTAIFKPFERGTSPSNGKNESFGLGLAFCRLAVEAHNGTIHVEDRVGGGCRFVICL